VKGEQRSREERGRKREQNFCTFMPLIWKLNFTFSLATRGSEERKTTAGGLVDQQPSFDVKLLFSSQMYFFY